MATPPPSDHDVRQLYDTLMQAWTDGDAEAYGRCLTDDADYVSFDGTLAHGRSAIVQAHDVLFRGVLAGSALVGEVEHVRFLTADLAIVHATGSVLMPWRTKLPNRRLSRQTLVAVERHGPWLWTSLHNTRVKPMSVPEPDALVSQAAHLLSRTLPDRRSSRSARTPQEVSGRAATRRLKN